MQLTYDELMFLFTHRLTLIWLAFMAVGLFAVDPHDYHGHMPWLIALLIWISNVFAFLAIYIVLARGTWPMLVRTGRRLFGPLLSATVFTLIYIADVAIARFAANESYEFDITMRYPFLLATFLILDLGFNRFALPQILLRMRPAAEPTPAASVPTKLAKRAVLSVGDRSIRTDLLLSMNSEEHYVHVTTAHEVIIVRTKLPDLLDQLSDSDGVRSHQSWWVLRNARPVLETKDGKPVLVFCGDKTAPISRSRQKEVKAWIDHHRDWA